MDAELKAKWVAALRGEDFIQHRGALCGPDEKHLCCIGVGLVVLKGADPEKSDTETAAQAIGLSDAQKDTLVDLNDGAANTPEHSFWEIADYIEANL